MRCPWAKLLLLIAGTILLICIIISPTHATSATTSLSATNNNKQPHNQHQHQKNDRHRRQRRPSLLVLGIDGGTESIRACCFDARTGVMVGRPYAASYATHHAHPGWAEQSPADWYASLGRAVRGALQTLPSRRQWQQQQSSWLIGALCLDTTCCSVVALDVHFEPLRPCLLWMDQRSAPQAAYILQTCRGNDWLKINNQGEGPLSAEWMICKALWIKQEEPVIWQHTAHLGEYQDYLNYKLTGRWCASACNAATRWHWDGEEAVLGNDNQDIRNGKDDKNHDNYPGRPMSLYDKLGLPEMAEKLPKDCLAMGQVVGGLTVEAAKHLNLPAGLPVVQGGPDAFVGMVGLGCIAPGQSSLITGSSHLHMVVSAADNANKPQPGTWGPYRGAPLPGLCFSEGGQSTTGAMLRWAREKIFATTSEDGHGRRPWRRRVTPPPPPPSYQHLDAQASLIPPGADGLVALETLQGARTPVTDPRARGAVMGLTLSHTRAHLWRALLEAVCLGTRASLEALLPSSKDPKKQPEDLVLAGGITRSPLWLQMHADVTGRPVVVRRYAAEAPLLGCAILAAVGGLGLHNGSVSLAVEAMVRTEQRVEPNATAVTLYDALYETVYKHVAPAVRPVAHALHDLPRGGAITTTASSTTTTANNGTLPVLPSATSQHGQGSIKSDQLVISPSLLACDWSDMGAEVQRCLDANLTRLHVDIFDGVYLDHPEALTFGPKMIRDLVRRHGHDERLFLELHMCVERPARYVSTMAAAGAHAFIFQWEAVKGDLEKATTLARAVVDTGMKCGVSINPLTSMDDHDGSFWALLETGLVSVVDLLGVEPGFGGQIFQAEVALAKTHRLHAWKEKRRQQSKANGDEVTGTNIDIMCDGGVNHSTARFMISHGANVLVSGSYLFGHARGLRAAVEEMSLGKL